MVDTFNYFHLFISDSNFCLVDRNTIVNPPIMNMTLNWCFTRVLIDAIRFNRCFIISSFNLATLQQFFKKRQNRRYYHFNAGIHEAIIWTDKVRTIASLSASSLSCLLAPLPIQTYTVSQTSRIITSSGTRSCWEKSGTSSTVNRPEALDNWKRRAGWLVSTSCNQTVQWNYQNYTGEHWRSVYR